MKVFLQHLEGDKAIWAVVALLALFSFLPVYSASSNLVYVVGNGTTIGHLLKHGMLLILGFGIIYGLHKIPTHYYKGLSILALPVVILQTSNLAAVVLMVYVARYLSKIRDRKITFKESIVPLWLPVGVILLLILPANFSTAAILFAMVLTLCFLGGYPLKYLFGIVLSGLAVLALFVLLAKALPDLFPNRVDTWINRVEHFWDGEDGTGDYQIEKAKIAIASGGVMGNGAGKSVMKHFLPQSSSDFIYAIIIEEYGLIGGLSLMFLYLLLLFRIVVVANANTSVFGKLVVMGVGLPIIFQALINMAVAVELFPVTGQTLPLISSGGTSIWMTCMAIGVVLSASRNPREEESVTEKTNEEHPLEILSGQL